MAHTRGQPYHPTTRGQDRALASFDEKPVVLENYYLPGEPEARIDDFVVYYNTRPGRRSGSTA